ncbi:hypothetical protein BO71DRAFT_283224, partial [Aspergillus ellipticus CBS 707.79]
PSTPFLQHPPLTKTMQNPLLTPAQRAIVKTYGGWTQFLLCFGLKPWNEDDAAEGVSILRAFVEED